MIPATHDNIRAALSHLSPDLPRKEWAVIGMAIKDGLGIDGFDAFDCWSQLGATYNARDCRAAWKSFRIGGRTTVGTLFKLAMDAGWKPEGDERRETDAERRARTARRNALERQEAELKARREAMAAAKAEFILSRATTAPHPYLKSKGHPDEAGLVIDDDLYVPMRDYTNRSLLGMQRIRLVDNEWEKKMLPGQRAKGAVYVIGPRRPDFTILVEGYATALSVAAAVRQLRFNAAVAACFSAGNIAVVAPLVAGRCVVLADNDASGTGQRYAEATGRPWAMPPTVGWDANDYHQRSGLMALCGLVMQLRRGP